MEDFVVFVLCHGRPNDVLTWKALEKYGYTGKAYIVCDDEDKTLNGYIDKFGKENVLVFNKDEVKKQFDTMDLGTNRGCVVYARNACFNFAKQLGVRYFCELDDDYVEFQWRYPENDKLKLVYPTNLDDAFKTAIDFLNTSDKILTVAFAQGGDYIGGLHASGYQQKLKRKAMNSFICDIQKPFVFNGTINEDVNTYTLLGSRGHLFFTLNDLMVNQADTQSLGGGMTNLYKGVGTYQKSFYTVVCCPSFVKIAMMGDGHYRIHHNINWNNGIPKILSPEFRKAS